MVAAEFTSTMCTPGVAEAGTVRSGVTNEPSVPATAWLRVAPSKVMATSLEGAKPVPLIMKVEPGAPDSCENSTFGIEPGVGAGVEVGVGVGVGVTVGVGVGADVPQDAGRAPLSGTTARPAGGRFFELVAVAGVPAGWHE
jgi:hypothetical protein